MVPDATLKKHQHLLPQLHDLKMRLMLEVMVDGRGFFLSTAGRLRGMACLFGFNSQEFCVRPHLSKPTGVRCRVVWEHFVLGSVWKKRGSQLTLLTEE